MQLEKEGYLERKKIRWNGKLETWWEQTTKGLGLSMASAARPIKRATAQRLLTEFLERVEEVNRSPKFLYFVVEVILFGSYLNEERQTLGDIDLAIRLKRKGEDGKKHLEMFFAQVEEDGREYESYFFRTSYGYYKVRKYLRNRSKAISLHDAELERILERGIPARVIFQRIS